MGKIKIDLNRHLCATCKHENKCEFEGFEVGEADNVFRCKKFVKRNENKQKQRVSKGETYYTYTYKDEKNPSLGYKVLTRIENESRIDNLLHEVGSYFCTIEEVENEINRLENK